MLVYFVAHIIKFKLIHAKSMSFLNAWISHYYTSTSQDFYMSETTPTLIYRLRTCQLSNVLFTPEISLSTHRQLPYSMPRAIFPVSRTCIANVSGQQNHGAKAPSAGIVFLLHTAVNYQGFEDFMSHKSISCLRYDTGGVSTHAHLLRGFLKLVMSRVQTLGCGGWSQTSTLGNAQCQWYI